MLVLVLCVLALASPTLFGGQLSRLAFVRFRGWWILVAALLAQIVIIEVVPGANRSLLEAVHVGTYFAAAVFVALNWRVPGLLVIAAGGASNGITIALNGGQLPASLPALQMAGIDVTEGEFINSGVVDNPVLPLLGDYFVWPEPLPFANVFSIGDVLIVLGTLYGAHKITGSRLVRAAWRLPADVDAALSAAPATTDGDSELADATPSRLAPSPPLTSEDRHTG